jgi:hypothetical protein
MAAGSAKHDWGDFRAAAKAGAIILALLTCYFSLGGCIYAPDGCACLMQSTVLVPEFAKPSTFAPLAWACCR